MRRLRAVQRGEAGCEEVAEAAAVEEELLAVRARAEHLVSRVKACMQAGMQAGRRARSGQEAGKAGGQTDRQASRQTACGAVQCGAVRCCGARCTRCQGA